MLPAANHTPQTSCNTEKETAPNQRFVLVIFPTSFFSHQEPDKQDLTKKCVKYFAILCWDCAYEYQKANQNVVICFS